MNLRPPGYEPDELPTALLRDIELDPVGAGDRTRTGTVLLPGDFKSPVSTIPPHRRISAGIIVHTQAAKSRAFQKFISKAGEYVIGQPMEAVAKRFGPRSGEIWCGVHFFDFFCLRPPGILAELAFLPQIL